MPSSHLVWRRLVWIVATQKKLQAGFKLDLRVENYRETVCRQLVAYLEEHSLIPSHQSAYRRAHSTETAVLKVISDAVMAADRGEVTLVELLDLSAAFDTVDHDILLDRRRVAFGIHGTAISWIETFVRGRTQIVSFAGDHSSSSPVTCGVSQGGVLGPMVCLLYTAVVIIIAGRYDIGVHSYADDIQLYSHSEAKMCVASISRLVSCIENINRWMSSNRLKLNSGKTDFILLGTCQQLSKINCKSIKIKWLWHPDIPSGHLPWCPGRWRDNFCCSHQTFDGSMFLPFDNYDPFVVLWQSKLPERWFMRSSSVVWITATVSSASPVLSVDK